MQGDGEGDRWESSGNGRSRDHVVRQVALMITRWMIKSEELVLKWQEYSRAPRILVSLLRYIILYSSGSATWTIGSPLLATVIRPSKLSYIYIISITLCHVNWKSWPYLRILKVFPSVPSSYMSSRVIYIFFSFGKYNYFPYYRICQLLSCLLPASKIIILHSCVSVSFVVWGGEAHRAARPLIQLRERPILDLTFYYYYYFCYGFINLQPYKNHMINILMFKMNWVWIYNEL